MILATQILAAVALVAAMAGVVWVLQWGGWMFVLGVLFTATIYQLGYKAKHGTWFNLID